MITSAQVVETTVTVTDNSPFQDYPHPDDHTTRSNTITGRLTDGFAQFYRESKDDRSPLLPVSNPHTLFYDAAFTENGLLFCFLELSSREVRASKQVTSTLLLIAVIYFISVLSDKIALDLRLRATVLAMVGKMLLFLRHYFTDAECRSTRNHYFPEKGDLKMN